MPTDPREPTAEEMMDAIERWGGTFDCWSLGRDGWEVNFGKIHAPGEEHHGMQFAAHGKTFRDAIRAAMQQERDRDEA